MNGTLANSFSLLFGPLSVTNFVLGQYLQNSLGSFDTTKRYIGDIDDFRLYDVYL